MPAPRLTEALEPRTLLSVTFDLSFVDDGSHAAWYGPIRSHMLLAADDWGARIDSDASLQIEVHFSPTTLRASGRSFVSKFVRFNGQYNVSEEGAVHELRTGNDPNGAQPDIEIFFQDDYLINEMWFDPDPVSRSDPPAPNRVDAYSVCLHELGHALGFNGFRDGAGNVPADYVSRWDEYVVPRDGNLFFTGPAARSVYGGDVPVTFGLPNHVGNNAPRPGSDLIPDLMNGVVFIHARRYAISELDFAVLEDVGVPVLPRRTGRVVGRDVFYNNSVYDGGAPALDDSDDDAVATDKHALLPGQSATFDNVTSYTKGINGVRLSIAGAAIDELSLDDFEFKIGGPAGWSDAPAPSDILVRSFDIPEEPAHVYIAWPDGAIRNTWLRVTVKPSARTGLPARDVFYFGNLVGESGDSVARLNVSALDLAAVKRALNTTPSLTGKFDFNRDGRVNALDLAAARSGLNRSLALLAPPPSPSPAFWRDDPAPA